MRRLLILPGNSPKNKFWGEEMKKFFQGDFDEVHLQLYNHWETGEKVIDVPGELEKIADMVEQNPDDEWFICAKSVGTLVTLISSYTGVVAPKKSLLFGMPLDLAEEDLFKGDWTALSEYNVPSKAFHNQDDPVASCEFSKNKIAELAPSVEFVEVPGDTHEYLDFDRYEEEIKQLFLN